MINTDTLDSDGFEELVKIDVAFVVGIFIYPFVSVIVDRD